MAITIKVTNNSMTPEEFNIVCFFLQTAHPSCKRVDDGVLFDNIPVLDSCYYDEMGREATTEEYLRFKIKDVCTRALLFRGDPGNPEKSYRLEVSYTDYRALYKGVEGACASCAHVRSRQSGELVAYDGGKQAVCGLPGKSSAIIVMHDTPDLDNPVNECWAPRETD